MTVQAGPRQHIGTPALSRTVVYHWDLLWTLIVREIQLRYRRSVLGIVWSLINPLLSLLIFVFLFQGVLKMTVPHYAVYVFSGLLAWNWFSSSLSAATYVLFQSRDLIRKPLFPTESLILVSVSSNLVNYLLALPVLLGLILLTGVNLDAAILVFPVVLVGQFLFTAGLCFVVSILNVYFRDVEHFVAVILTVWFYLTPVFYRSSGIDAHYAWIFAINPMAQFVIAYRGVFLTHTFPDTGVILGMTLVTLACFAGGFHFFRRFKGLIVDEL